MAKLRYMIVSHPSSDNLRIEDGLIKGRQPIHDLVGAYHWARLDDDHILLKADYSVHNHEAIHSHDKVSVLPAFGSSKKIHKHVTKPHHLHSVSKCLGIDETHTTEDVIDLLAARFGPMFST